MGQIRFSSHFQLIIYFRSKYVQQGNAKGRVKYVRFSIPDLCFMPSASPIPMVIANNNNDTIKMNASNLSSNRKWKSFELQMNEWMKMKYSVLWIYIWFGLILYSARMTVGVEREAVFSEIALIGLVQFIGVNKVFAIRHKKENEKTRGKNFWHTRTRSRSHSSVFRLAGMNVPLPLPLCVWVSVVICLRKRKQYFIFCILCVSNIRSRFPILRYTLLYIAENI